MPYCREEALPRRLTYINGEIVQRRYARVGRPRGGEVKLRYRARIADVWATHVNGCLGTSRWFSV